MTETPNSPRQVVAQTNFALRAEQAGFTPQAHDGTMLYCQTTTRLGSMIPAKRCYTELQLQLILHLRHEQRAALAGASAAPGCGTNGTSC